MHSFFTKGNLNDAVPELNMEDDSLADITETLQVKSSNFLLCKLSMADSSDNT